ncbi:Ribosomal silencing factor RsfS [Commensalibacter sp. Nvir]|uniref:ribosome silencing factor n=1 Tax=Commensalibacter sp. Nvir TaxID=3069817 RepID=UPI002D44295F|nr:Ribosomal silencing factor RsfS [Commensalibacter sp. Nvir]
MQISLEKRKEVVNQDSDNSEPYQKEMPIRYLVDLIVSSLEDDKAENIVVMDLVGKTTIADYMVVATGKVDRQIMAMAGHLDKVLFKQGIKRISIESSADWVLIDSGDIIIHLFREEAREYYSIERIWGVNVPNLEEK